MHFPAQILELDSGQSWRPCISYPLDLLDELTAGDLSRANPLLSIRHNGRMFIWIIERIPKQHDVCSL
jgi:hypothetical protein